MNADNTQQSNNNYHDSVECHKLSLHTCNTLLTDPNKYFYIREIAFFTSYNDAKSYSGKSLKIDMSSQAKAEEIIKIDLDNSAGLFGQHQFDDIEGALSLHRSNSTGAQADYGSRVKFSLRFKNSGLFANGQSYVVVTYKTNITENVSLKLGNFWGEYVVLIPDVTVSDDKYIRSDPVNIKVYDHPIQDFYERLNHCAYNHNYTDSDLIYIAPMDESGFHRHKHIEILYCTDGEATIFIHAKKYSLKVGDIIIVNPMDKHNVTCKEASTELYSIKFLPETLYPHGTTLAKIRYYIALWQKKIDENPIIDSAEVSKNGIDAMLREIIENFEARPFAYEVIIQSRITSFFAFMLRKYCTATEVNINISNTLIVAFEKAITEAQKNLCDFNTEDAARVSNLSYNYFCSNFKKVYGTSFSAYLESMRLHEAERLLLTTGINITDIAMSMGFASASHFIQKFKIAYGITPYAFRAKMGINSKSERR